MKNVFLDLGTHYGQGLREFIQRFQMNDTWTIHTFEANPITYEGFIQQHLQLTPWVICHNAAVSNRDGEIQLNTERVPGEGDTGMGTSVIDMSEWAPWNGKLRDNFIHRPIVPCIDFSTFLTSNFSPDDNIIVKMDIEGSEYDVLEKMIADGSIAYIKFIAVEWHSPFFVSRDATVVREEALKKYFLEHHIRFESWH